METPEIGPKARLAPILTLYPAHRKEIEERYVLDPVFAEVCDDYVEVRLLVESWEGQDGPSEAVAAEYQELLVRLEAEIQERLERYQATNQPMNSELPSKDL